MALQTLFAKTVLGGSLPNNAFGASAIIAVGGFEIGASIGGDLTERATPNHPTPYRAHQLMISNGGVAFSSLCLNTTMLVSTLALHIASGTIVITSSTTAFVTALTAQDLFDIYNANVIGSP